MRRRSFLLMVGGTLAPLRLRAQPRAAEGTLRIYLARHGESAANAAKVLAGHTDVPLTEKGRQQARELAEILRGVQLDAVYSSTLSRSRETALIAAGGHPVVSLDSLQERH